jgi:hypothetical protein
MLFPRFMLDFSKEDYNNGLAFAVQSFPRIGGAQFGLDKSQPVVVFLSHV